MSILRGAPTAAAPQEPVWMVLRKASSDDVHGTVTNVGSGTAVQVRLRISCDNGLGPVLAQADEVAPEGEVSFVVDTTVVDVARSRLMVDWRGPDGRRVSHAAPLHRTMPDPTTPGLAAPGRAAPDS